jgi:hypothetical protein
MTAKWIKLQLTSPDKNHTLITNEANNDLNYCIDITNRLVLSLIANKNIINFNNYKNYEFFDVLWMVKEYTYVNNELWEDYIIVYDESWIQMYMDCTIFINTLNPKSSVEKSNNNIKYIEELKLLCKDFWIQQIDEITIEDPDKDIYEYSQATVDDFLASILYAPYYNSHNWSMWSSESYINYSITLNNWRKTDLYQSKNCKSNYAYEGKEETTADIAIEQLLEHIWNYGEDSIISIEFEHYSLDNWQWNRREECKNEWVFNWTEIKNKVLEVARLLDGSYKDLGFIEIYNLLNPKKNQLQHNNGLSYFTNMIDRSPISNSYNCNLWYSEFTETITMIYNDWTENTLWTSWKHESPGSFDLPEVNVSPIVKEQINKYIILKWKPIKIILTVKNKDNIEWHFQKDILNEYEFNYSDLESLMK